MSVNERFINEIRPIFKDDDELNNFIECCRIPLKKSIKINLNKISPEKFIEITSKRGWRLTNPGFIQGETKGKQSTDKKEKLPNDIFYIDRDDTTVALGNTFMHQSGFIYIQEVAAGMPARFLDLKEGDLTLDISAAPGGKTCQIADYMLTKYKDNPGFIVSNDVSASRQMALFHNISRMGAYNTGISTFNGFAFGKNLGEIFDNVLVDAPCSGEGTGFKSDFALKTWRIEEINKIAGTQFQLLISAIKATKPGGSVIFSTCTMNPYENEGNLKRILEFFGDSIELENVELSNKSLGISNHKGLDILSEENATKVARFWPHIQKTGGFFISMIRKKDSLGEKFKPKANSLSPNNPFKIEHSKSFQKKITEYLGERFGIKVTPAQLFVATQKQIYLTTPKFLEANQYIQFERIGVPVLKMNTDGSFVPLAGLGSILGTDSIKNFVELNDEKTQDYAFMRDIEIKDVIGGKFTDGYVIIKWNGFGIGVGKIIDGRIKNKYIS